MQSMTQENMAVFQTISDLVTGAEFLENSGLYMQKHRDMFDKEELEQETIFEEYQQIIGSQLFKHYSQDSVQAFFKDFSLNFAEYAKINSDAVETLYGLTDFNKFKKQVLEVKNGDSKTNHQDDFAGRLGQNDGSFFWNLFNEDINDKSLGWHRKITHKGNIDFVQWQRGLGKGGDKIARCETVYNGIKLNSVLELYKNYQKYQGKDDVLLEHTVLEQDDTGMPTKWYQRFKMPFMTERENLMWTDFSKITKGPYEGRYIWLMGTYEDPENYPLVKDRIRMTSSKGVMFWEEDGSARAVELSTFNMGGYFPMRLMNMALGSFVRSLYDKDYVKLVAIQKEMQESTGSNSD